MFVATVLTVSELQLADWEEEKKNPAVEQNL